MAAKWHPPDLDDLLRSYDNGASVKALSDRHGVARHAIGRILRENGRGVRNRSEGMFARMAQTSPEERARLTAACHSVMRGRRRGDVEMIRRARIHQSRLSRVGKGEGVLHEWLTNRGLTVIPQQAIDRYNIDLGCLPVAVELLVNAGSPMSKATDRRKVEYLTNRGIHPIYIWVTASHPLSEAAADEVVTFYNLAKLDPSPIGKHRVIRGSGDFVTEGRGGFN